MAEPVNPPHSEPGKGGAPHSAKSHWIPVGHDINEQDLPPLTALSGAIVHADNQKKRAGQEFADEALSDAASFVEVGKSGFAAVAEGSAAHIGDNFFAYISASAAVYLLTHIHKEGVRQEGKLKNALNLLDEYMKTKRSDVLHKAGLELEQVPKIALNQDTHARTLDLLKVYEVGDRVAATDVSTSRKIASKLTSFGQEAGHALSQTFANAYWRNPRKIGDIFMSAVRAAAATVRLAHLKISGSNEIRQDHKKGLWDHYREQEPQAENKPIDLSDVVIEGMEEKDAAALDPKVLEESLHIDAQYQDLRKERMKFLQLAVIQGVFIGASVAQGVYNGLKGDGGWAFVNFSSASAASGPFKFFTDMYVDRDALLRTHRAEMGHKIASLAGKSAGSGSDGKRTAQRDNGPGMGKAGNDHSGQSKPGDADHNNQQSLQFDTPDPS